MFSCKNKYLRNKNKKHNEVVRTRAEVKIQQLSKTGVNPLDM